MASPLLLLCSWLILAHSAMSSEQAAVQYTEDKVAPTQNSSTPSAVHFYTEVPLKITESDSYIIHWSSSIEDVQRVIVTIKDENVAVVSSHNEIFYPGGTRVPEYNSIENKTISEPITVEGTINVTAKFIGFNELFVALLDGNNAVLANESMLVDVLLYTRDLAFVYQICLTVVLIIIYINMGANLNLELVKRIVKQPFGPCIGLLCQYGCMPLISFSLGLLIFPNEPLFRLGLFTSGSSPGGGLSNMWTHLLGGSLDLSIMMTFCSTIVALGAVPFWLVTLGKVILNEADFVIPYVRVFAGIMLLVLPCFVGIAIQLKLPRVTKWMKILLTPLSIFNIIFIFSFGLYSNFYLFSYLSWKAIGAGFGQSIFGHISGFLIAFMCRRSLKEMIAISIETAVQNNGIAFLLLKMSLDKPAGDIAILIPGCVALFMPLPLLVALLIKVTYFKFFRPPDSNNKIGLEETSGKDMEQTERKTGRWSKDTEEGEGHIEIRGENLNKKDIGKRITQDEVKENGIDNPALDLPTENS